MSPLQKPIFDEKQPFQPIDIIRVKFAKIANLGVFAGQSNYVIDIFQFQFPSQCVKLKLKFSYTAI